jgi:hypothetical protein
MRNASAGMAVKAKMIAQCQVSRAPRRQQDASHEAGHGPGQPAFDNGEILAD